MYEIYLITLIVLFSLILLYILLIFLLKENKKYIKLRDNLDKLSIEYIDKFLYFIGFLINYTHKKFTPAINYVYKPMNNFVTHMKGEHVLKQNKTNLKKVSKYLKNIEIEK